MTPGRPILAAVVLAGLSQAASAERLTIAMSTPEVQIGSNFSGATITIFGVVESDAAAVSRVGRYEVVVLLLGPPETVVARRKDRVLGIWANRASETIVAAPSFYALTASAELDDISTPLVLERLGLGFDRIAFAYGGRPLINDPAAAEFRAAYTRLKQTAGLFSHDIGVEFVGDTIFRAAIRLPTNVPVGRYTALAYLFSAEALIAHAEDTLQVSKTGIEQTMAAFARSQSLVYGLFCVALAIFVGWLGGVIFRRD